MKNLRFILLPLIFLGLLTGSCKSDDDNSNNVDRIVGSWEITDVKANGVSVYDLIVNTTQGCFLQTTLHFRNDYTFTANPFEVNDIGACVSVAEKTGVWEKSGDVYTYAFEGESSSSQTVTFVNNNQFFYAFTADNVNYEVYLSRM